jgi:lantibiotic modifying enzyme
MMMLPHFPSRSDCATKLSVLPPQLENTAWDALRTIAEALRRFDPEAGRPDPSVGRGAAGIALFLHYWAAAVQDELAFERAEALLDWSALALTTLPLGPSLYSGFSGVAWTIAHLEREGLSPKATDLDEIDAALLQHIEPSGRQVSYDLITGLVGCGVYFLERLPSPAALAGLERVVCTLASMAEPATDGLCWVTPPELLPTWQAVLFPDGKYDLGMAHGVAGIIALLAGALRAGVATEQVRELLDGGIRWLFRQQLSGKVPARFPSLVARGRGPAPEPSRMAWCYGDPGVAAALLLAADAAGNAALSASAIDLLRTSAVRNRKETGVEDAPLCHGSAGLAHLFHRTFRLTGDPVLAEVAGDWLGVALHQRHGTVGIAGFASLDAIDPGGPLRWRSHPGFLQGAAGIGLALISAITSTVPAWDRLLLLSLP